MITMCDMQCFDYVTVEIINGHAPFIERILYLRHFVHLKILCVHGHT